jgi:hypothetical protein
VALSKEHSLAESPAEGGGGEPVGAVSERRYELYSVAEAPLASRPGSAPRAVPPTRRAKRSPILIELALVAFLVWAYEWLQDLAPLRRGQAFRHALQLLEFERRLGVDPEHSLDHWLAHQPVLAYAASTFYGAAIFGVTFGFAAWTWWRRPELYGRLRNDLVVANLLAFAVFWAYPVAPPRMLPGFIDVVAKTGGLGWHNSLASHADQLAAMPSMHMGYALWCAVVAWRLSGRRRAKVAALVFGVGYLLLTAVVVLATGNHYLLDVLAGLATTGVAVLVVEVVPRALGRALARSPRPTAPQGREASYARQAGTASGPAPPRPD